VSGRRPILVFKLKPGKTERIKGRTRVLIKSISSGQAAADRPLLADAQRAQKNPGRTRFQLAWFYERGFAHSRLTR
jgi:hypothetical protein